MAGERVCVFYGEVKGCFYNFSYKDISVSKAILRMAKAIWKTDNKDLSASYWESQMDEVKQRYLSRAKAALDALIKGSK